MQPMHRRGKLGITPTWLFIIILMMFSGLLFIYNAFWSTDGRQAKKSVEEFYQLERNGNYGSAWELLHSSMQTRFSKDAYIQKRAQVFMQQLGASTFEFEMGKVSDVGTWGMSTTAPAINDVHRVHVTQRMLTVFGELELEQDVYIAQENDEWKLLWSYQE